MICALSEKQQKTIHTLVEVYLQNYKEAGITPDYTIIFQGVFDLSYVAKIQAGENETFANQFALQATEISIRYSLEKIKREPYSEEDTGNEGLNNLIRDMNKAQLAMKEYFESLIQVDSTGEMTTLKTFLSIKEVDENLKINEDNITDTHQRHIGEVVTQLKNSFLKQFETEKREKQFIAGTDKAIVTAIGLRTETGLKHFLRATQIGKKLDPSPFFPTPETPSTRRGNLIDELLRLYFTKYRNKTFQEFVNAVNNDTDLLKRIEKVLYKKPDSKINIDEFNGYKNQILSDIKFIIQKFKMAYEGYFLIDMADVAKDVYSEELGVKGSLDFIGVSPTGEVKVIDITTTNKSTGIEDRYKIQLSLYHLILKKAGIKVENTVDLFVIPGDTIFVTSNTSFFRVIDAVPKTIVPLTEEELKKEIELSFQTFRKEVIDKSTVVENVVNNITRSSDTQVGYLLDEIKRNEVLKDTAMLKRLNDIAGLPDEDKMHILYTLDALIKNCKT